MNHKASVCQEHLQNHLPDYLDLLHQMVDINSFTTNREGVNRLARHTADLFELMGFTPLFQPSSNPLFGSHLFLTRFARSESMKSTPPSIAFVSHLDTVFSPDEEIENHFHWRIEGNRVYGPGTVDIKGGTVMAYIILDTLRQIHPALFDSISWILALDASEETLSEDFGKLCLELFPTELVACLIMEGGTPSNGQLVVVSARKGKANFSVKVEGRSAHAGNRHAQGANAIVQMAHTIQKIADLTDYERQLTFNVGLVRGGSVINRVPHSAEAEVEMRTFSPDVFEEGVKSILAINGDSQVSSSDGYSCKVIIQQLSHTDPWPRNPQTEGLLHLWKEAGEYLDIPVMSEERGGLSDGNLLWKHFPTLDGLGPVGNNAHCSERSSDGAKDQEYTLISSFVPKALLNITAILKLLTGDYVPSKTG